MSLHVGLKPLINVFGIFTVTFVSTNILHHKPYIIICVANCVDTGAFNTKDLIDR